MAYWNEPRQKKRTCVLSFTSSRRFQALMLYPDASTPTFDIYAARWNKTEEPQSWQYAPEGWDELWPRLPLRAPTHNEGFALRAQLWHQLEEGIQESNFAVQPASHTCVEVLEDHLYPIHARIYLHHSTGLFEARYFVHHADCGHTVQERWDTCTFADDLNSAQQAAVLEMGDMLKKINLAPNA